MSIVEQARAYERKYHEELYGNHELFEAGTWLYKPAGYALKSFEFIPAERKNVRALDLGGGVGRHSIPLAKRFGSTAGIVCVDLLDSAITRLVANTKD